MEHKVLGGPNSCFQFLPVRPLDIRLAAEGGTSGRQYYVFPVEGGEATSGIVSPAEDAGRCFGGANLHRTLCGEFEPVAEMDNTVTQNPEVAQ
ncbi:hypothetical protein PoB_006905200 [Plakobranchus ocellatus]|uniref:Uncharacterized protein n=1 Tax=Plakobranchus ocellatus TaxID=259542 RepID=A0AAV4DEV3_9GAST|nr:hypothetical protein PoB_006905200 [Plakobranchus ocellatus]